ncbi:MAG: hypothetical protein WKG07_16235 [Hymenobacter sp.]
MQQTAPAGAADPANLAELKAEYARLLYLASKTANGFNRLMFLFASSRSTSSRCACATSGSTPRSGSGRRRASWARSSGCTSSSRASRSSSAARASCSATQLSENNSLLTLKTQQDQMVQQLSQQEQGLRQELEERQRAVAPPRQPDCRARARGNSPRRPRRPPGRPPRSRRRRAAAPPPAAAAAPAAPSAPSPSRRQPQPRQRGTRQRRRTPTRARNRRRNRRRPPRRAHCPHARNGAALVVVFRQSRPAALAGGPRLHQPALWAAPAPGAEATWWSKTAASTFRPGPARPCAPVSTARCSPSPTSRA